MPLIEATAFPDEAYVLVRTDWSGAFFRDTFTRTSVSGWTPADTGQPYTVILGAAANFSINGLQGQVRHTAVGTDQVIMADVNVSDVTFTGTVTSTSVPAGGTFAVRAVARFVNTSNLIDGRIQLAPGSVTCVIRQRIAGVDTLSATVALPLANTGVYSWTFQLIGTQASLRFWDAMLPEPTTWNVTFTTAHLTAGDIGLSSTIPGGTTTPLPISFLYDNLVAYSPSAVTSDCAIVTRRNTVTGEIVNLRPHTAYDADGAMLALCGQGIWWDTEPPLNVELEYCTFACDAAVTLTTNPDFETSAAGWTVFGGALTQDCTVAKVGTCSGRLTPNGINTNPSLSQTGMALLAGIPVIFSGWAMSPQGWNAVLLRLDVTYADLSTQSFVTGNIALDDNEWRLLSFSFTPSQAIVSSTFSFIAAGIPPNTTLFNVDELRLAQFADVAASACDTVAVLSDSVWLKSPLHPCSDIEIGLCDPMLGDCGDDERVSYVGTFESIYDPNTVVLGPQNRKRVLPISRPRRDAAASLRILAHDCAARDLVIEANAPGTPLLFQAPVQYCIEDRYITVGPLGELLISVDQREPYRLMTLPYQVVDRPEGPADGPCGTRIDDLCDTYSSWAAINIAGLSWEDLPLGEASPNGPGQGPGPEAGRVWDDVNTDFADWNAELAGGTRDWNELKDGL